jgi:hypothetical protein
MALTALQMRYNFLEDCRLEAHLDAAVNLPNFLNLSAMAPGFQ